MHFSQAIIEQQQEEIARIRLNNKRNDNMLPKIDKSIKVGVVHNARLLPMFDGTIHLLGNLESDAKGRFHRGSPIRTSWVEVVEYDSNKDLTRVETRNSIYIVEGHLLESMGIDQDIMADDELKAFFRLQERTAQSKSVGTFSA